MSSRIITTNVGVWEDLPNNGPVIPAVRVPAAVTAAVAPPPAPTVPAAALDLRWAPRRTPAQIQEAAMRLHAERMAAGPWAPPGWVPPRPKPAALNPNAFPTGALTLSKKNKQVAYYEEKLRNLEALQKIKGNKKLQNVNSVIASFLTGTEKKSVNQQIKEVKNIIKKLKSASSGGTRRKRHLRSRFKSSKRKTT
jgi:hypothetical protein